MSKKEADAKAEKKDSILFAKGVKKVVEKEKEPAKAPRKKKGYKKKRLFEGSVDSSNSSISLLSSKSLSATDNLVSFDTCEEMLFVGLIDSVRDETSYNQLITNISVHGAKYKTDFWEEFKTKKEEPVRRVKPKTQEEFKETLALLDDVADVLEHEQTTDSIFYRPRTECSREFVDNIEKISGQVIVQKQSIEDVANYYKMSKPEMTERIRHYLVRSGDRMVGYRKRIEDKEHNEKLIAEELRRYMNTRMGLYTTIKMMVFHLKDQFENKVDDYASTNFRLNMINVPRITKILKKRMNYRYKASYTRPPQAFNPMFMEHRVLFPMTTNKLELLGYNFIYIDEATVASDNLSTRTWQVKGQSQPLVRPGGERINMIAAYILKGKYAFMLKRGSTTSEHIAYFVDMLHKMLVDNYTEEYLNHTLFIMDNAKVHVSKRSKKHFRINGYPILTLPPYTPEYSKVENTFNLLKMILKKKNLYKKRLEYVVAHSI